MARTLILMAFVPPASRR